MSIFLQSIERFIDVPEVEDPMLVLIVGCVGLGLNVFCVLICHGESRIPFMLVSPLRPAMSSVKMADSDLAEGHSHSHGHGHGHGNGHSHGHGHTHSHTKVHHHGHTHGESDSTTHNHSPASHDPRRRISLDIPPISHSALTNDEPNIEQGIRAVKVPNIASQLYQPISHYMHSHHSVRRPLTQPLLIYD